MLRGRCTVISAPCIPETADEIMRSQKEDETKKLKEDWSRYCFLERHNVESLDHVAAFWLDQGSILSEAVMPDFCRLVTAAAIERSFSLARLIDTKNQQNITEILEIHGTSWKIMDRF